jgi:rubrerythrin
MLRFDNEALRAANQLEATLNETVMTERRTFIKKGSLAALAASLPLAGFITSAFAARPGSAIASSSSDIDTLSTAMLIEQKAVNTYSAAAGLKDGSGNALISGAYLQVALQFAADHSAHAGSFRTTITALGGTPPADTTDTLLTAFPPGPFSNLTSADGIFKYALGLEVTAAKLWFANFQSASDSRTKQVFADIAPVEATHAAIFRAALKLLVMTSTDHDAGTDPGKSIVPYSRLSLDSAVF